MTPLSSLPASVTALGVPCTRGEGRQWYGRSGQTRVYVCEDVSAWGVAQSDDDGEIAVGYGGTLEAAELACERDFARCQRRYAVAA
jgi:hypothetical protein